MPKGRVLYVPETSQGRLIFLGEEIPVRVEDVAMNARRPGTRVRFDLTWDDGDLRASNVRCMRGPLARERGRRPAEAGGRSRGGGSER